MPSVMTKSSDASRGKALRKHIVISYLLGACLLCSACSSTPFSTAREINEECQLEMAAARTAAQLRDEGKPRERLAEMLPPLQADSSRLLWQMHVILEESYTYPQLNAVTYATYRFEHCMRELQNKPAPKHMQEIYTALLNCQNQHGASASASGTQCIVAAFPQTR